MSLISIIVPVYNKDYIIEKTLQSLVSQDYNNYEILLIDDGSTDNSGKICDEYAAKDKRVKVFHKENGGVSSARNLGIEKSQGDYLVFCDADDFLPQNALSALISGAEKNDADLVVGGMSYVEIEEINNPVNEPRKEYVISKENFSKDLYKLWLDNNMLSSCAKLYKKGIIISNNILFNPNLIVLEDFVFVLDYLNRIKVISVIKENIYDIIKTNYKYRKNYDYMGNINYAYLKLKQFVLFNNVVNEDILFHEIYNNCYEACIIFKSLTFNNIFLKRKRAKDILELEVVDKTFCYNKLYLNEYIKKYGKLNFLTGKTDKIKKKKDRFKDYKNDLIVIKNEKGGFYSLLYGIKNFWKIYFGE